MANIRADYSGTLAVFSGLGSNELAVLKKELTYADETILRANQFKKYGKPANPYICLINSQGVLPAGLMPRAIKTLMRMGHTADVHSQHEMGKPDFVQIEYPDWLRNYQLNAITMAHSQPRCLEQLPAGSGKTMLAAYYLKCFPTANIVFSVPAIGLAYQTQKVLEEVLGEPVGLVGDSHKDWKRVTVGVIDSLAIEAKKSPHHLNKVQVIVHDEVHFAASDRYLQVQSATYNAYYCLGLSATIWRNDGADIVLEAICGPLSFAVPEEEVVKQGGILSPTYIQLTVENPYLAAGVPELIRYSSPEPKEVAVAYDFCITKNQQRSKITAEVVETILKSGKRKGGILIIVQYIEHGKQIQKALEDLGLTVPFLSGKSKGREKALKDFTELKTPVVIASHFLKQGQDIPTLEYLILADCNANKTTHYQTVGRALRVTKIISKLQAFIIDLTDTDLFFSKRAKYRVGFNKERYSLGTHHNLRDLSELKTFLKNLK